MINRSFFKVGLYLSNIITILFIRIRGDYMPRQPRKESSTGVYHVMIRGVNKQLIFQKILSPCGIPLCCRGFFFFDYRV